MSEVIDLSIPTLMKACKGNVNMLPSFMVHDNHLWLGDRVQLDSKNRIHMRRATLTNIVRPQVPVRAGIWHGLGVQEFHIDLKAHHLQGGQDAADAKGHAHSRLITLTDNAGRNPKDRDYGNSLPEPNRLTQPSPNEAAIATDGKARGVRSSVLR